MAITQVNTNEVHDGAIFDEHINSAANIAGTKIQQATTSARGTVTLAGVSGNSGVVDASDPRIHSQNTDTGTTSKTYNVNSSPVVGDNTALILNSGVSGAGGAVRYNDTYQRVEYSTDYNGARNWHVMAGLEDLGKGIIYRTCKLGSASDTSITGVSGTPTANTVYSLSNGYFSVDGLKLLIAVNGDLKSVEASDYTILNSTQIQFVNARNNSDTILMIVYADIIYRINLLGSQALDPSLSQFQTPGVSLMSDTNSVMVFVNGAIKSAYVPAGVTPDYIFLNTNTIQFNADTTPRSQGPTTILQPTDRVDIIVVSMGVLLDMMEQIDGVDTDTFRIADDSNDMGIYSLLFGNGITQDMGIRTNFGRLQIRELNKPWTNLWDLASMGLPSGVSGYVLEYDPTQITNNKWVDPRTLNILPDGTNSYMLIYDDSVDPVHVKWVPQPIWQSVIPPGQSGWFLMADPSVVGGMRWVDLNVWLRGWSGWQYISVSGTSGQSGYSQFLSVAEMILIIDKRQPNSFSWTDTIDLNDSTVVHNPLVVTGNVFNTLAPYNINNLNGNQVSSNNGDMLYMASNGKLWTPDYICGDNYSNNYSPPAYVNIIPVSPNDVTLALGSGDQILIMNPNVTTGLCWTNTIDCGILSGVVSGTSGISSISGHGLGAIMAQDGDILAYDINSGNNLGWLTNIDLNDNTYTFSNIMYGIGFNNLPVNGNQGNMLSTMYLNVGGLTQGILYWVSSPETNPVGGGYPIPSRIISSQVDLTHNTLPISSTSSDGCSMTGMVVLDSSIAGGAKWTNTIDLNVTGVVTRGYSV